MRKCFVARSILCINNASIKPSKDFELILQKIGFKNIGLPPLKTKFRIIGECWDRLSYLVASIRLRGSDLIAVQYPEPIYANKILFSKINKYKNNSIVLIHDINELRGGKPYFYDLLKNAKSIISHTPNMSEWIIHNIIVSESRERIIELGIFDYISTKKFITNSRHVENKYSIAFAGNLAKAPFLEKININDDIAKIKLFGNNITERMLNNASIDYCGSCSPDELLDKITNYDFGLVWDGEDIDKCTGIMGEYLKYNSPYKLSSYLAAGIPVIVWNKMAIAKFVIDNGIGICINSLNDLSDVLKSLNPKQYESMSKASQIIGTKVRNGYYYTHALFNALKLTAYEKYNDAYIT